MIGENWFSFNKYLYIGNTCWVREGDLFSFLLSFLLGHQAQTCRGSQPVLTVWEFTCVLVLLCLKGYFLWCSPVPLSLTIIPPHLSHSSLICKVGKWMATFHLGQSIPMSLTICIVSRFLSLYFFCMLQEKGSLMMAEQVTD